jgi:hypothetical protein
MDTRHMCLSLYIHSCGVAILITRQRGAQFFFDIGELELGNGADKIEKKEATVKAKAVVRIPIQYR